MSAVVTSAATIAVLNAGHAAHMSRSSGVCNSIEPLAGAEAIALKVVIVLAILSIAPGLVYGRRDAGWLGAFVCSLLAPTMVITVCGMAWIAFLGLQYVFS